MEGDGGKSILLYHKHLRVATLDRFVRKNTVSLESKLYKKWGDHG